MGWTSLTYLCDKELRELLPQLAIVGEDGIDAFDPNIQIQPASIDLRLSSVFWRPLKHGTLELRHSKLLEVQPRRYYRRVDLKPGDTILLRPGELLLGRTAEEFSIPADHAASLMGRSSFARLGMMVSATGGFINPGWRGRMPLQLVNFSPNNIKLVPGLPVCQVRFVKLSSTPEKPYGHPDLQSKYMNDDGGPSYWWRDKRIRQLHQLLVEKRVDERIQHEIGETIGPVEPEIVERLERMITKLRMDELQNGDTILERFGEREDRRRTTRQWLINLSRASFTVGITASLWVANKTPIQWWHFAVWTSGLLLLALSIYALKKDVGDHLGAKELRARRATK